MSQNEMNDSRFNMWRAVFAMAHVDGKVSAEEIAFAESYIAQAGFSDAQKEVLKADLHAPQKVGEMLAGVSEPSDQAEFFQFSQMLAWADGDYSVQEKAILERLSADQTDKVDADGLAQMLRDARKAAVLRRALEDEQFEEQARDVSGFANVIRYLAPSVDIKGFEAPDDEMFTLWRAVFSLVHVDGDVSEEEESYIRGMMDVFHFSEKQRKTIEADLKVPGDVVALFRKISSLRHRRQFFILARTIVWCDGIFHDDERAAIEALKVALGDSVSDYESELRWIDRKPDVVSQSVDDDSEERMMKDVVRQMVEFYKEEQA